MKLGDFFPSSAGEFDRRADILPPLPGARDFSDIAKSYARLFASEDGRRVLDHLQLTTLHRAYGPDGSDGHIRHLEGQRYLLSQILRFIDRCKTP